MADSSSKAKSKLQRLLSDLELNSGTDGLSTSDIGDHQHDSPTRPSDDGLGDHDSFSNDDGYDSATTDTTDTRRRHSSPRHRQQHGRAYDKFLLMEKRVMQLMQENKVSQLQYDHQLKRKDLDISELHAHLNTAVRELEGRQKEIEARAPIFKLRIEEFREKLRDLRISDAQYDELRRMPAEGLHVLDDVKVRHARVQDHAGMYFLTHADNSPANFHLKHAST